MGENSNLKNHIVAVNLKKSIDDSYEIVIGRGFFENELSRVIDGLKPSNVAIVLDSNLSVIYGSRLSKFIAGLPCPACLIPFTAGERNKSFATVIKMFAGLARTVLDRQTLVVAFGGGVTGDMAGFLASIALRGIPFVQVPTSLLAMVDSSIGGKTGVDTLAGKNLVGAFYQPKSVIIDTAFLDTLPEREYINGMAEIVKHGLIFDAGYYEKLEKHTDLFAKKDPAYLIEIIRRSCEIKASVVETDEKEKGLRQILNFGHTVGHAIENATNYRVPHGYAVAMGMAAEMKISAARGWLKISDTERASACLGALGLMKFRDDLKKMNAVRFNQSAARDKKNSGGNINCVLLDGIGRVHEEDGHFSFPVTIDEMTGAVSSMK